MVNKYLEMEVPADIDAEAAVLSAILIANAAIHKISLDPGDFYKPVHVRIFEVMRQLVLEGAPIDIVTIANKVGRDSKITSELSMLLSAAITDANISYHADILKELSIKRHLRKLGMSIYGATGTTDEILALIRNEISFLVKGRGGSIVPMSQIASEIAEYVERRAQDRNSISGVTSGFEDIDRVTDGFQKGDLIILAGRPGSGKSALGMAMVQAMASDRVPVGVISLEMGKHQLGIRSLASMAGIEIWRLRKGFFPKESWTSIAISTARMASLPVYFSFDARKITDIERITTQMIDRFGIGFLMVDYLQLARSDDRKKREQEVAEISRVLKTIAQTNDMPVLALAQLNRASEIEKRRPMLADLRESGAIEQDADVVMFLYHEEEGIVDIIFAKGRNIGIGTVRLQWDAEKMTFRDLIKT